MPGPASSQNDWFAAANTATRALYQRRRRTFPGTVATAANAAGGSGVPGGGGGGGGGDHGGGGVAVPGGYGGYGHILNNEVSQGAIPASATAAGGAVSAATAAISAPPVASPAATTLSGLAGALYALRRRRPRRGFARGPMLAALLLGSVLYAGIIARAITGPAAPGQAEGAPLIAPGAKLKLTAAPAGYALASWPDSLAIATGRTSGAIAADGKAFAAVDGSTATAYEPAAAAGVPGSLVVLIGTRPNGQRVGVIIRPGVGTAAPWVWYSMKNGTFTQGAAVTEAEKLAIDNATKGVLP